MALPHGPYVVPPAGRVKDKVIVITGGGAGLGREASLLLAREGAFVVVTDIIAQRAKDVAAEIEETGQPAMAVTCDVTVETQVQGAVEAALSRFGRLDVMVANAGVGIEGKGAIPFEETTIEAWDAVTNVNLRGVFLSIKHAARAMKDHGGGSIVVTSSAAAFVSYPGMAIYTAGKGGVNALVRGAAFDLGKYGIRVNAVCPSHGMSVNFGLVPEAPVLGLSWEQVASPEWHPEDAPMPLRLPRHPMLIDNAYPILYLASDETAYLSGACIPAADGGTMGRVAISFPEGWSLQERLDSAQLDIG
jgi:NAD(P)-dependent dehydrogenase (short-subunit alcohol dehydrogenase family)